MGRWYVVWACPSDPGLVGVHGGLFPWGAISERLPGWRYGHRDGTRLCGWKIHPDGTDTPFTYLDALRAYFAEGGCHQAKRECYIYIWDQRR